MENLRTGFIGIFYESHFHINGRHRALRTLKGSFSINMDGIGPYILLRVHFFRNIDGIGPYSPSLGLTVPALDL